MKHHCEGFDGWFRGPCPSPDFTLPPGQAYTDEQVAALTVVVVVVLLVGALILLTIAVSSMAD